MAKRNRSRTRTRPKKAAKTKKPSATGNYYEGKVVTATAKHYDHDRGYGFAHRDEGDMDGKLFFHINGYREAVPRLWGMRWLPVPKERQIGIAERFALGHKMLILEESKTDEGGRIDTWTFLEDDDDIPPHYLVFKVERTETVQEVQDPERRAWVEKRHTEVRMVPFTITTEKLRAAEILNDKRAELQVYKVFSEGAKSFYGTRNVVRLNLIEREEDL